MVWEHKVKVNREFWHYGLNLSAMNNYAVIFLQDGTWDINFNVFNDVEITYKLTYAINNLPVEDGYMYFRNYGT